MLEEILGFLREQPAQQPDLQTQLREARDQIAAAESAFREAAEEADVERCIYELKALHCRYSALYRKAKAEGLRAGAQSGAPDTLPGRAAAFWRARREKRAERKRAGICAAPADKKGCAGKPLPAAAGGAREAELPVERERLSAKAQSSAPDAAHSR